MACNKRNCISLANKLLGYFSFFGLGSMHARTVNVILTDDLRAKTALKVHHTVCMNDIYSYGISQ